MPHASPLEPRVITAQADLVALVADLLAGPAIAVDTESNSLYVYQEQVCLIQFSTPTADYVVDTLAGLDYAPLGCVFAEPGVEKVFHAAGYDVLCMKRDFGFELVNLFDTMVAARILGWPLVGLGDLLREHFGVHTNKRFQRYDWGQRPLAPEALHYACQDTHYLLQLREIQAKALSELGRWEEAQESFAEVAASVPASRNGFDPQDFWRIKGANDLTGPQQALLRALAVWRDQEARHLNRPPFKVLGDATLMALARAHPRTSGDLARIPGLKPRHVQRYGEGILQAIREGARAPTPQPPPRPRRRPRAVVARFGQLREWRGKVAAARGVDPDVVIGNEALWALAERNPQTPAELECVPQLGPWRRKIYGTAICDVLRRAG